MVVDCTRYSTGGRPNLIYRDAEPFEGWLMQTTMDIKQDNIPLVDNIETIPVTIIAGHTGSSIKWVHMKLIYVGLYVAHVGFPTTKENRHS